MIQNYTHRATGQVVEIEVQAMNEEIISCKRPGRFMETIPRADFDRVYELVLPKVDPSTIPRLPVEASTPANPLGPPIASVVAPDADPLFKLVRAALDQGHDIEDAVTAANAKLDALGAKVEAIYKVVAVPAAPATTDKPATS